MNEQGPPVYENWRAALEGVPSQGAYEYPLFTDAHITGQITDGYGPYQLLNTVPYPLHYEPARPSIMLRLELHLQDDPERRPSIDKTDAERYHGGFLTDEVAALVSLALGIRLKSGGMTRHFECDPRGTPVAWDPRPAPILLKGIRGTVLPEAVGIHSLMDIEPLALLPQCSPPNAIALVRAARLYQDALWIVESEPALSWVMLVSAVETAAGHWRTMNASPLERLRTAKPTLVALLERTGIDDLPAKVAEHIADSIGSTKKFRDFILAFLPPPPPKRPYDWACHPWKRQALRETMNQIYDYRSKALHGGLPFPAPMCEPPYRDESWEAPAETPIGLAAHRMGGVWVARDTPLLLHTFEYIVRRVLLNWWATLAA
jgi:hypothetical protein